MSFSLNLCSYFLFRSALGHSQVVTLLITDIRSESEEPDLQLAEVRVVLKKADELEEGWWADAKDIVGIVFLLLFYDYICKFRLSGQAAPRRCRPNRWYTFLIIFSGTMLIVYLSGPARVYTMRGKYRQFILRVTAENKDKIVSANVPVSAERTLKLTVELVSP